MESLQIQILAAIASLVVLALIYQLIKEKWPEYYFGASDQQSIYISQSPIRFLSFRALPIFLTITPILGMVSRDLSNENISFLGLLIGLAHAVITNGKAILMLFTNSRDIKVFFNKPTQIVYHFYTIFMCSACGFISGTISSTFIGEKIAPTLQGLIDNTWSTGIILLIGLYSYNNYQVETNLDRVFKNVEKSISPQIKDLLKQTCKLHHANYNLALAICMTEALQRPRWLRRLETLKSVFYGPGTYGIMQVKSNKPISDEESVKIAVKKLALSSSKKDSSEVIPFIKKYNSSEKYQEIVTLIYDYLQP